MRSLQQDLFQAWTTAKQMVQHRLGLSGVWDRLAMLEHEQANRYKTLQTLEERLAALEGVCSASIEERLAALEGVCSTSIEERLAALEGVCSASIKKVQWERSLPDELGFWRDWFATKGSLWPDEYKRRFDPNSEVTEVLHRFLGKPRRQVSILDVGAGPASSVGTKLKGYTISVTAVDALADLYEKLYEEFNAVPPVRTQFCHTEKLRETFQPNQFDVVYAENTLDHHYDPMTAIVQMVEVAKPGGYAVLYHVENEAEREGYNGLHQWNFKMEGDDMILWNKHKRVSLRELIGDRAELEVLEMRGKMVLAALRKASA